MTRAPGGGAPPPFSEKDFYLEEFRGRSLVLAAPASELRASAGLREVLDELAANRTPVIVVSTRADRLGALGAEVLPGTEPRLEGAVWRALRKGARAGVVVGEPPGLGAACRELALRLRVAKVVWIDAEGGLRRADGARRSFVDLEELRALLAAPGTARRAVLEQVEAMLASGVPAVNVCALEGLGEELFTYAGSGTLFTAERYMEVRPLALDDYDAAHGLLLRGTDEGYLAPRSEAQVDRVLAGGFGAFIEGRHLAGVAALLVDDAARVGEIAALYTLTRFLGEGVGVHLVRFALERARELGLSAVFACTTAERVGAFFERQGFREADPAELPAGRWDDYDGERRARLRCYRFDVESGG